MNLHATANLFEAALWFSLGVACGIKAFRGPRAMGRIFTGLAVAFVLFGASDLIESRTGAWWRPLWLLVLKGACVCGFVTGFAAYYRARRPPNHDKTGA